MSPIVGIDLGTTNSLCAVFMDGKPVLIPNVHRNVLTPSVVGMLDDGQLLVGQAAKEFRVSRPERCASRFKRHMGTDERIRLGSQDFTAPQLSSMVLSSLKRDAEAFLKVPIVEAVITVPAYFNDHQRRATKLAGELAGLKVRRIINEPTAAALAYGFHDRQSEKKLLVIDLGGGTFDVTLMEIFEGTLEIVSTSGESMLGGEDFTDRLVSELLRRHGLGFEICELKQPLRVSRLRKLCEEAKLRLGSETVVSISLPDENGRIESNSITEQIHRDEFELLMKPLLVRLMGPIDRALRDANLKPDRIDEIILVGGATRLPALQTFVNDRLGKTPQSKLNPDEVVALGAAVQAALLAEDRAVEDMVMTDVCPHTLGVEISKDFGSRRFAGFFSPIIHRNTTIPVARESVYQTVEPNQTEVRLRVYQGESRKVEDNLLLGELLIADIPPSTQSTEFLVRFTYDTNGILEVEAIVPASGRRYRTVLTQSGVGLSQAEIQQAVEKMQTIKFFPRDEVENQRLLRFCEHVVGEVSPELRSPLESAIDYWEHSMSSGDRELFQQAKQELLVMLSQLGFSYDE